MKYIITIIFASLCLVSCAEKGKPFSDYLNTDNIESIEFQGAEMESMNEDSYKADFLEKLSDSHLSSLESFKEGTHFFTLKMKDQKQVYTAKINKSFIAIDARVFGEKATELKTDSLQFEIVWELED